MWLYGVASVVTANYLFHGAKALGWQKGIVYSATKSILNRAKGNSVYSLMSSIVALVETALIIPEAAAAVAVGTVKKNFAAKVQPVSDEAVVLDLVADLEKRTFKAIERVAREQLLLERRVTKTKIA